MGSRRAMTAVLHRCDPAAEAPPQVSDLVLVDHRRAQHLRWRRGERLEHLFEGQCDRGPERPCVDVRGTVLTYRQVDEQANQLARHLLIRGIGPGHRVALLFDDSTQAYVAMLAVLKAGAAYVPLDVGFPADRIAYIVADSAATAVLSMSHLRCHLTEVRALVIAVDDMARRIARGSRARVVDGERGPAVDDLAYIIYTSGSTGKPKGVAVGHPPVVNFVRVAAELYGYRRDDRVYQGLTIAFDFSFEEIWVPWAVGACLVPKASGGSLLGVDLHGFLSEQRVTAMCCVPTLLATIEEDLPALRFLLVSGEACPQDLVTRWHRPDRRFLNVYGPTEATVTATWAVARRDRPLTIGVPLPTYATVVLDPDDPTRALPHGATGEIGIAGIGLAKGYVNRDDLTAKAFIPDFLGIPGNVSGRIYRTGDLGRVTPDGEIEYLGRIDLQVKIRGYRIELPEIESVMLQVPGVAQAVVDVFEPAPDAKELVGYYSVRTDTAGVDEGALLAHLKEHLPPYMVPAYLEHLEVIPMTTSDKADRKNLPAPKARRGGVAVGEHVEPAEGTERILADLLATVLGVEKVSATAHFFDELGANSLVMSRFSAAVRTDGTLPAPAMRELYQHPTITGLAATMGGSASGPGPAPTTPPVATPLRSGSLRYVLSGVAQLILMLSYAAGIGTLLVFYVGWLGSASGLAQTWVRATVVSSGAFLVFLLLPMLAKWLLVGHWTPRDFPLWGLHYLRFWLVAFLVRANPLAAFVGTPVYNLYLRSLGARVGRGAVILARGIPVATDLISIGAGTIVRKDAYVSGYRADAGRIRMAPVRIGRDVVLGEQTVLDIDTAVGDGARLGHASSLQSGQEIPAGESWHGSPARPGPADLQPVPPARCGRLRRFLYGLWLVLSTTLLWGPLGLTTLAQIALVLPPVVHLREPTTEAVRDPGFHLVAFGWTSLLFLGGLLLGLVTIATAPRLVHRFVREDEVYPLYGVRYWCHGVVSRATNSRFYGYLFGDSSAIPHYLRWIGYRFVKPMVQSGSNFGVELKHESPYLTTVGTGTMVSDGLSVMNADYSNTSFRLRTAHLGNRSFFGNNIVFPPGARTGDNCLYATKVRVPTDGPFRVDVGLLGSPAFEIPRSVARDAAFDELTTGEQKRRGLRRKNRHNLRTALLFVGSRLVDLHVATLILYTALDLHPRFGLVVAPTAIVVGLLFTVAFHVLLERLVTGFRPLTPQFCSILQPYFWRHERFWKVSAGTYLRLFNGTPMKGLLWRALGVRIGRRVFDDGCGMPEKSLVMIGDDVTLNAGSVVQAHSLEDGAFKSDHIVVGSGSTIGPHAFVHYGVTIGKDAVLDADSFLMKGTEMSPASRWRGNPATEVWSAPAAAATSRPAAPACAPPRVATRAVPPVLAVPPAGPVDGPTARTARLAPVATVPRRRRPMPPSREPVAASTAGQTRPSSPTPPRSRSTPDNIPPAGGHVAPAAQRGSSPQTSAGARHRPAPRHPVRPVAPAPAPRGARSVDPQDDGSTEATVRVAAARPAGGVGDTAVIPRSPVAGHAPVARRVIDGPPPRPQGARRVP
jgi:non-ribosomal peptide synthetase-like protein